MKTYFVKLKLVIGEYEKSSSILVRAANEKQAGVYAMYCESHYPGSLDWESELTGVYDDCGGLAYRVQRCEEVSVSDYEVMSKYLNTMTYEVEDLMESGNYKHQV